jgi:hypothetical protein
MQIINIHQAKIHLKNKPRHFGVLKGKIKIAKDFDAPLSDDVLADFEGS